MGLWMQESSSCSLPCCFYREKPFLLDSGPVSPPPCVHGLCVPSTSEAPQNRHLLFICLFLALIFAGPLVLSVGSKGHPEQFHPSSSSSSPFLGCVTPSCRLCSQGCFGNCIFFMDQREIGGKVGIPPVSPGEIVFSWVIPGMYWCSLGRQGVRFHPGCSGSVSDTAWPPAPEGPGCGRAEI